VDRLSVIGLILALATVVGGHMLEGGAIAALYNLPALLIVVLGTIAAVMIQTPWHQFKRSFVMLKWIVWPPQLAIDQRVETMTRWSHIARSDGFLVLENELEAEQDPMIRESLMLLIDGTDPEHIRQTLETRIFFKRDELGHSAKVFEAMGGYSPTLGILGAVLGLIQSMQYLDQPEALGGGIATAFVATIYGVGFANLLYLPIHHKLRNLVFQQALYYEMVLEGVLLINQGENPTILKRRLDAYRVNYGI